MGIDRKTVARIAVHLFALLPLIVLVWDFAHGNLTANPIREAQLRTGKAAITLLLFSLACRPVSILTGFTTVLALRRPLGIYAFTYAAIHFINFIGIDYGFDFALLQKDLFEKRYAIAGFAAFMMLLPLAVTSTSQWKRRLGRNWYRLHRMVYLAAILAVVHFVWQTKADFRWPIVCAVILAVLLAIRLPLVRKLADRHFNWPEKKPLE